MKSGCEDHIIFQLVSCAFLRLQSIVSIEPRLRGDRSGGLTRNLLAVFGSMTFRMSRTSWVSERPTCPCFITKLFGALSEVPGAIST
jgi:hypothetical protein